MRIILPFFIAFVLFSCNNSKERKRTPSEQAAFDAKVDSMVDNTLSKAKEKALFDTVGLHKAPVKVLKSVLFEKEYSNYRDIRLTYKNVSDKDISAIRFRWKGVNAFNEPADMGDVSLQGYGSGFIDSGLGKGLTKTSEWDISSADGKKIILAWPYEVAFTDGTSWKIGE